MNKFMKKAEGFFTSRGFSAGVVTALVIALVVVVNVIIYTLTSLFGLYLTSPIVRDYGISGVTDGLFAEYEESGKKVTVTFCMAEDDLKLHETGKYVHATVKAYEERYDFIDVRYVNLLTQMETYTDEDGKEQRRFVDLSKYKKEMNKPDGTEGAETHLLTHSVIFEHEDGSYRVLTDTYTTAGFADFYTLDSSGQPYAYSGEEIIGAMISWVCRRHDQRKTVYFTQNHGETVDVTFGNLLTAAGYYIDVVDLRKGPVPDDAALVVVSNPTNDFERASDISGIGTELESLEKYLKEGNGGKGGKLYVALDPYAERLPHFEELLAEYGISVVGGEGEYGYSRELVLDPSEAIAVDSMSFVASFGEGEFAKQLTDKFKEYNTGKVLLSRVSRLNVDEAKGAESLLYSSSTSHAMWEGETVNEDGGYTVAAYSSRNEGGGSESEIFVVPSVLMTNSDILVAGGYSNRDFVISLLDVMCEADTALYGTRNVIYGNGIVENLTQRTATIYTVVLLAIPVALAIVGAVVVVRRKKR